MFIIKAISVPNIFGKKNNIRNNRKHYKKRNFMGIFKFFVRFLVTAWLVMFFIGFYTGKKENVDFEKYFKIEEGAYTKDILDEDKIKSIKFDNKIASNEPLIIIFHTHFSEEYADEKSNSSKYTVADAGNKLAEIFSKKYGISVVHDMGEYDVVDGKVQRDGSYERSGESVAKLVEKYPTAKILIDLHRDAYVEGNDAVEKDGKKYAKLMSVVGVCGLEENGEKKDVGVENKFISENLKYAYNFKKVCDNINKEVCKEIYLKPYRYSTYIMPESILLECGNEKSTFEEVINSLEIAAKAIVKSSNIM